MRVSIKAQELLLGFEPESTDEDFVAGYRSLHGVGQPIREDEALSAFLRAADKGVPSAQFAVAKLNETGRPRVLDLKEACSWYKAAARGQHVLAAETLALILMSTQETHGEGIEWLFVAATLGSVSAAIEIARTFENGGVRPRDDDLAVAWYTRAMRADDCGLGTAEYANLVRNGRLGLRRDEEQARRLDAEARRLRDACEEEELQYFRIQAEAGAKTACRILAQTYRLGWYRVSPDHVQASYWESMAT
jgi:TPR repeat protein